MSQQYATAATQSTPELHPSSPASEAFGANADQAAGIERTDLADRETTLLAQLGGEMFDAVAPELSGGHMDAVVDMAFSSLVQSVLGLGQYPRTQDIEAAVQIGIRRATDLFSATQSGKAMAGKLHDVANGHPSDVSSVGVLAGLAALLTQGLSNDFDNWRVGERTSMLHQRVLDAVRAELELRSGWLMLAFHRGPDENSAGLELDLGETTVAHTETWREASQTSTTEVKRGDSSLTHTASSDDSGGWSETYAGQTAMDGAVVNGAWTETQDKQKASASVAVGDSKTSVSRESTEAGETTWRALYAHADRKLALAHVEDGQNSLSWRMPGFQASAKTSEHAWSTDLRLGSPQDAGQVSLHGSQNGDQHSYKAGYKPDKERFDLQARVAADNDGLTMLGLGLERKWRSSSMGLGGRWKEGAPEKLHAEVAVGTDYGTRKYRADWNGTDLVVQDKQIWQDALGQWSVDNRFDQDGLHHRDWNLTPGSTDNGLSAGLSLSSITDPQTGVDQLAPGSAVGLDLGWQNDHWRSALSLGRSSARASVDWAGEQGLVAGAKANFGVDPASRTFDTTVPDYSAYLGYDGQRNDWRADYAHTEEGSDFDVRYDRRNEVLPWRVEGSTETGLSGRQTEMGVYGAKFLNDDIAIIGGASVGRDVYGDTYWTASAGVQIHQVPILVTYDPANDSVTIMLTRPFSR